MFDYGFANFRRYPVAEKGTPVKGGLPVRGGRKERVGLVINGDLTLLIPKGGEGQIELRPNLPEELAAPVEKGEAGEVEVLLNGRRVAALEVVAAEEVEGTGVGRVLRRLWSLWEIG